MAKAKLPANPTHRATLATGETVDYYGPPFGAHHTHWSFGGVDSEGKPDGSPVRVVPVTSVAPIHVFPDAPQSTDEDEDE